MHKSKLKLYCNTTGYFIYPKWHPKYENGKLHKIFEKHNTLDAEYKTMMRDSIDNENDGSKTDKIDTANLFSGNVNITDLVDMDGLDGIAIQIKGGGSDNDWMSMITVKHPTDYEGNYYKQYRGSITVAADTYFHNAKIGVDWLKASNDFSETIIANLAYSGDIFVPNGYTFIQDWKQGVS